MNNARSFFPEYWLTRYAVYFVGLVVAIIIAPISGPITAVSAFCFVTISAFRAQTPAAVPRTLLLNAVMVDLVLVLVLFGQPNADLVSFVACTAVAIRMPKR